MPRLRHLVGLRRGREPGGRRAQPPLEAFVRVRIEQLIRRAEGVRGDLEARGGCAAARITELDAIIQRLRLLRDEATASESATFLDDLQALEEIGEQVERGVVEGLGGRWRRQSPASPSTR